MTHLPRRCLAFALFLAVAVAGSAYYWVPLRYTVGAKSLGYARTVMLSNALEWWSGMAGRTLTHYREGFQVARIDSATGRLLTVHDLILDQQKAASVLRDVQAGQYLVLSIHNPSLDDELAPLEAALRQQFGWNGSVKEANLGSAMIVLARDAGEVRPRLIAVKTSPTLYLEERVLKLRVVLRDY